MSTSSSRSSLKSLPKMATASGWLQSYITQLNCLNDVRCIRKDLVGLAVREASLWGAPPFPRRDLSHPESSRGSCHKKSIVRKNLIFLAERRMFVISFLYFFSETGERGRSSSPQHGNQPSWGFRDERVMFWESRRASPHPFFRSFERSLVCVWWLSVFRHIPGKPVGSKHVQAICY